MSILIKKMEMPKGCWACPFAVGKHYECLFTKKSYNWGLTTRPSDCPLVDIQSPHGRLIDAESLEEILTTAIRNMKGVAKFLGVEDDPEIKMEIKAYTDILNGVKEQLTIIEAEGSET